MVRTDLHHQPVVRQRHACWQLRGRRGVAEVVRDVREVGLAGANLARGPNRLGQREVRRMRPASQRVEHEHVEPVEQRSRRRGHVVAVGQVRKAAEPEAQNLPAAVANRDGHDLHARPHGTGPSIGFRSSCGTPPPAGAPSSNA